MATKRSNAVNDRQAKRTRFHEPTTTPADVQRKARAAEAADEQAFDEQVLADLEEPSHVSRRKAVKVDGYDSDSSDDGEGVVRSRHAGTSDAVDEDDDMFAPTTAPGNPKKLDGGKKEEKFLALGDIEGQEFNSGDPHEDDEHSDDDSDAGSSLPEDDDARERKAKEGMGFELSSFNMKAEMEEGKFAEDGTFHRSFDPHGVHDKWMDGIDDREMRRARKVKKKMAAKERARVQGEEADAARGKDALSKELLGFLAPGETVLEALQRLGNVGKKAKPHRRKGRGEAANALPSVSSAMDVDANGPSEPLRPISPTPIERVTSLASTLMSLGNIDVYEETYESLLRVVRRSGAVPKDWIPQSVTPADARYEYRWAPSYVASTSGQASATDIYGPYSSEELFQWRDAAYFGDGGERVQLRRVGESDWGGWDVVDAS